MRDDVVCANNNKAQAIDDRRIFETSQNSSWLAASWRLKKQATLVSMSRRPNNKTKVTTPTHTGKQRPPLLMMSVGEMRRSFRHALSILESLNRTRPLGSHQPHHLLTSHLDSPMDSTMPTSYRPAAGVRRGPCPPPRRGTDWGHGPSPKPLALAVEATHAGHVQASRSLACLDH